MDHRSNRRTTSRIVAALAIVVALAGGACVPSPDTNHHARLLALTGPAAGTSASGPGCPDDQTLPRVLDLDISNHVQPTELVVEVCAVRTTAHGGAPARGSWVLTNGEGTLSGTLKGSWSWSYFDVLSADLEITGGTGTLAEVRGTLHLRAPVERMYPYGVVGGSLELPD